MFILSNTIHEEGLCCYNNKTNKCVSKNETETEKIDAEGTTGNGENDGTRRIEENSNENNLECPQEINGIFNNCGMAGIYQPVS